LIRSDRFTEDAALTEESPLDPKRAIVDPHHHLWEIHPAPGAMHAAQRFLLPELLDTIDRSGHNVTHTVFVECHAMYRASGREELRPVGEVEFANGIAAMSASGGYGQCRIAAGIVGSANPRLGGNIAPVLEALIAAGGGRFRGVRFMTAYSEAGMFGAPDDKTAKGLMKDPGLRAAAGVLQRMGLSLDIWCFHTQLDELVELATALPDLTIILDHLGTPETLGSYVGREAQARAEWATQIARVAQCPNIMVKLGGLGMNLSKPIGADPRNASSMQLAAQWRPYIEICIAAFTPRRCMFESNFPPDNASGTYGAVWNAFKRLTSDYSEDEKTALFSATAKKVYRLE
jgi:L-fuconolactonase